MLIFEQFVHFFNFFIPASSKQASKRMLICRVQNDKCKNLPQSFRICTEALDPGTRGGKRSEDISFNGDAGFRQHSEASTDVMEAMLSAETSQRVFHVLVQETVDGVGTGLVVWVSVCRDQQRCGFILKTVTIKDRCAHLFLGSVFLRSAVF